MTSSLVRLATCVQKISFHQAIGSGAVLNGHSLRQRLRQMQGHQESDRIDQAARRELTQQPNGATG